jgi:hypothetical protein
MATAATDKGKMESGACCFDDLCAIHDVPVNTLTNWASQYGAVLTLMRVG